ncbi:hypothetical protein [Paenibacillus planticolens]|uniref:DUF5666 domain-containing protein n=1 Tax=Paenibacillus planticolens TaxID=2654976 RepID=A0ABX1ZZS0_9BACL|nr:hypothetical protein [Paenibacillus planticolens]NOV04507.1 hypothetical protein [Paenibacillus planticolens]
MRKKLPLIIISITLVALMVCGWTAYASTSSNSAISTSVKGAFKSVSSDAVTLTTENGDQSVPLAKSVWVYRNDEKALLTDLKAGDQIEIIVNSKQQAAYVKASSPAASEPVPSPTSSASASAAPEPTQPPAAAQNQVPAPATQKPDPQAMPSSPPDKSIYPGLQGIDLNVDGKHFKLHIGQSKGAASGTTYDLSIKPEDAGMIHLKGDEAAQWIQKLLASIDLKSPNAEQKIAGLLAKQYNLDVSKLHVSMKTKWEQQQAQMQQNVPNKPKEDRKEDKEVKENKEDKQDHKDDRKDDRQGDNNNKQHGKDDPKTKDKARSNGHHDD